MTVTRARRIAAMLTATLLALSVLIVVNAGPAHATPAIMWRVQYGNGYTSNPPRVWSNRVPTWDTGGQPHLTFQTDRNGVDYYSGVCPNGGVCWSTHTAGICGPARWDWQWDGNSVIYDCNGVARWASNTSYNGIDNFVIMTLWGNGCITIHFYNDVGNYWQLWWANSANPDCQIQV